MYTFYIFLTYREEFATKYLETRTRLSERLNEIYRKITEHKRQRDDMAMKLNQVKVKNILIKTD